MPKAADVPSHEGMIVALARLDPKRQGEADAEGVHEEVRKALSVAFEGAQVADFECLGRYDAIYLVRVRDLVYDPIARMRYVEGLKKLDVQYAYLDTGTAVAFWESYAAGAVGPFVLLSYLRVRDDFTYITGGRFHERAVRPMVEELFKSKQFPVTLLLRVLGWPDYLFLAAGDNLETIARFSQTELRGLQCQDVAGPGRVEVEQALKERKKAFPACQPVFSRTYTVLGYPPAANLTAIHGQVRNLQIDVRLRPGADDQFNRGLGALLGKVELPSSGSAPQFDKVMKDLTGSAKWPTGDSALQFGCEDAAVWLDPQDPNQQTSRAGPFLHWCRDTFSPAVKDFVSTTEVRLALPKEIAAFAPGIGSGKDEGGLECLPEPDPGLCPARSVRWGGLSCVS